MRAPHFDAVDGHHRPAGDDRLQANTLRRRKPLFIQGHFYIGIALVAVDFLQAALDHQSQAAVVGLPHHGVAQGTEAGVDGLRKVARETQIGQEITPPLGNRYRDRDTGAVFRKGQARRFHLHILVAPGQVVIAHPTGARLNFGMDVGHHVRPRKDRLGRRKEGLQIRLGNG